MTDAQATTDTARRRIPPALISGFWLILLPLALAGFGIWQLDRSVDARQAVQANVQDITRSLDEIRPIAADAPGTMIRFEGGRSFPASMAVAQLENALGETELVQTVAEIRHPFAYVTIAGGVLALLGGAVGLLGSSLAGLSARRSRDQLVRSFTWLRITLPFFLAAVMLGLGFAGVGATVFETLTLPFWGNLSGNAVKLGLIGIILAGVALYCAITAVRGLRRVFALVEPEPIIERARVVTEHEAPALWTFVRNLATRMEAGAPDTIVVGLTSGFYVTESRLLLLPEERLIEGRTLHMPAPMLELLDTAEIAAIVGHELAHFAGEDTRYSQRFVPIYSSLQRSLDALYRADINGDFGIAAGLRLGYHALSRFDTAVAHWSRLREFEADRHGSAVSGTGGAASALVRVHIADPCVHFVLNDAFRGNEGLGPDLVAAIASVAANQGFVDPAAHLEDRQAHPTDSHPPTIQRIQALGVSVDDTLLSHATRRPDPGMASFGRRAFPSWDQLCRELSADFLRNASAVRTEYREELKTAAAGVTEPELVVHENTGPMAGAMIFIIVLFGVFLACTYLFPYEMGFGGNESHRAILTGVLGFGMLLCLAAVVFYRRRAARPLMVFTPEFLRSPWLSEPVRWDAVNGYQVYASTRFALQLYLDPNEPLPSRTRFSFYNKVKPKRHMIELDAIGIRGMKADAFSDLVGRYLVAAHARRALQEQGLDAVAVEASPRTAGEGLTRGQPSPV
ncbi:M48 family metallopeptidase [Rhizobium sp. SSA_523]|uniref:M48 family metallopeptidase n=1 Tax=Rhizobium sp. SSA_523 TaxID=2952477 RepID=UPI00209083F3|nr:M48 family metallopeptidase [Rhizobium sp. SSA_523]MCO5733333.1 M48 family metallopeptidase [Rhizobium sp. SSA_523]WKC21688.1 M48 family metallopeptidase [Rhizobium sp. SSA_523]